MDELTKFSRFIKSQIQDNESLDINDAREIVKAINNFLYTNYEGIGQTSALGSTFEYLSDFHKYWEKHHAEILNCQIDVHKCELVADALHDIYLKTNGGAFREIFDTCNLSPEDICRVRFLTANQDFRGSRVFSQLADVFNSDNSIFDIESIKQDPEGFLKEIKVGNLSQGDKRISYAQKIAEFLIQHNCVPYELINKYNNDIYKLRMALINCKGAGYGNKKTDMFLRDMVVLGVWKDVANFDKIDVASDVNTIKVALRTGIISTAIPLVSSFLDIFCHQYSYIDKMNALAWRRVWEIWQSKYPLETISSPCLMDYFVYGVIGRQFCKASLAIYKCDSMHHEFRWHTSRNRTCQICFAKTKKRTNKAHVVRTVMPCNDAEGSIAILNTAYVKSLPPEQKFDKCPFSEICGNNKKLMPPVSISILGQTGWTSAYTRSDEGGGGIMA